MKTLQSFRSQFSLTSHCFVFENSCKNPNRDDVPEGFQQLTQPEQHVITPFGGLTTRRMRPPHHHPRPIAHFRNYHHDCVRPAGNSISVEKLTPNIKRWLFNSITYFKELYKVFHFPHLVFRYESEQKKVIINSGWIFYELLKLREKASSSKQIICDRKF